MADEKRRGSKEEQDMEAQQGEAKSIGRQEALKRIKKQHPQRDVPRVDEDLAEEQTRRKKTP